MMKRLSLLLLIIAVYTPVCLSSITDVPQTADGYLVEGEYASLSVTLEGSEELYVMGGGAFRITAEDYSYLEVQYTSTPLSSSSGIYDIVLFDDSDLLYLGGVTEEITLKYDSTAELRGGTISGITIYRRPQDSCYVTIYCQKDYLKTASGISGLWADGSEFNIQFVDVGAPFPATWNFVNVEIVPEPATLVLLGLGACAVMRKRK